MKGFFPRGTALLAKKSEVSQLSQQEKRIPPQNKLTAILSRKFISETGSRRLVPTRFRFNERGDRGGPSFAFDNPILKVKIIYFTTISPKHL